MKPIVDILPDSANIAEVTTHLLMAANGEPKDKGMGALRAVYSELKLKNESEF